MKIELEKYQKQNNEKLDAIGVGISVEKKHREFIKKFNINLSALVRDVLDMLMQEKDEREENEK